MKKLIIYVLLLFALLGAAHAACPVNVQATTTSAFLLEVPSLNTDLGSCPIELPGAAATLLGNGAVQVDIAMNDGTTESLTLSVLNKKVTGIATGTAADPKFVSKTNEDAVDQMLQSADKVGTFSALYQSKDITIEANSFVSSVLLFFGGPLLNWFTNNNQAPPPSPLPEGSWGKPDNCDDTYLAGHSGYTDNKDVWDSYSANSDGVCQSQYGGGAPSPCVYTVQQSISGNPYYLCWYNN